MLNPRLINCVDCGDIESLLKNIDCKIFQLSQTLYNNIAFMLNKSIPGEDIIDLLNYKRILTYKYNNSAYAENYSLDFIIDRVKLLTLNCDKIYDCNCGSQQSVDITSTTTTTSTSTTTSTTTDVPLYRFNYELTTGTPTDIGTVNLRVLVDDVILVNTTISVGDDFQSGSLLVNVGQVVTATITNLKTGNWNFGNKILKDGELYQPQDNCFDCTDELITSLVSSYVIEEVDTNWTFVSDIGDPTTEVV